MTIDTSTDTTADTVPELAYPPRVTPFTEPFWKGLDDGILRTTRCRDCSHMTFPPKPICPECWKSDLDWVDLRGTGTLYSFTEVSAAPATFADEVPYTLCLVDLDEGVRCLSRIDASWESLHPDIRVRVKMRDTRPVRLFEFEIDSPEDQR